MYISLFTCLNVRAVHLELLPSMTCKDFLMAFVRFCNTHSIPDTLYCDNAQSFISATNILSKSFIDNEFSNYLTTNSIKFYRIPLYAAWFGAPWERLLRTIKACLFKLLGRKHTYYFNLITLLSDIKQVVNSRPLTYLHNDSDDLSTITPNSFLKLDNGRSILFGDSGPSSSVGKDLRKTLELRDSQFQNYKEIWMDEYMLSLREKDKDRFDNKSNKIKTNDIVLIYDPVKPRYSWNLGRVVEILPGKDNKTRCVKVKRSDNQEGIYPICHLYPMELEASETPSTRTISSETDKIETNPAPRTSRAAALRCLKQLKCNF